MNAYTESREAAARKRAEGLAKERPPIEFVFGEDKVVIIKQPMQYDYPAGEPERWNANVVRETAYGQKFKSLYKVEFNGIHRGWIMAKNGWGQGTELKALDPDHPEHPAFWGNYVKLIKTEGARDKLAAMVPALVREGSLGTIAEQAERRKREREEKIAREREERSDRIVRMRENLDEARAKLAKDREDVEVIEKLLLRGVLSNMECDVLVRLLGPIHSGANHTEERIADLEKRIAKEEPKP